MTTITAAPAMAMAGYRSAPASEQVLFGVTTSFAFTIGSSRSLNYVRERRRNLPKTRNVRRIIATTFTSNSIRIHHFLPGMVIGFGVGGTVLFAHAGKLERAVSLPYGLGLALVTDELRTLIGRNNPYWGGEHFALAQGGIAALASLGLVMDFLRRGRGALPEPPSVVTP